MGGGAYGPPSLAYANLVPVQHSIYPGSQNIVALCTKCQSVPWTSYAWYRMQGCVVHRGIQNVGWKSSCVVKRASKYRLHGREPPVASFWMEHPTDKGGLLLKRQIIQTILT